MLHLHHPSIVSLYAFHPGDPAKNDPAALVMESLVPAGGLRGRPENLDDYFGPGGTFSPANSFTAHASACHSSSSAESVGAGQGG